MSACVRAMRGRWHGVELARRWRERIDAVSAVLAGTHGLT
ncbi:UNVERIFIED_ORG: hypothetical protein FHR68_000259 [Xanthomonas campestris]